MFIRIIRSLKIKLKCIAKLITSNVIYRSSIVIQYNIFHHPCWMKFECEFSLKRYVTSNYLKNVVYLKITGYERLNFESQKKFIF